MKKLPIGISNLREMIEDENIYVDKTWYVHQLATTGKYYFLSRPRRFGKSLFIDTLKEAFEGNQELFKGLWIYDKWDWTVRHPVIHISFSDGVFRNRERLDEEILDLLNLNQQRLKITCSHPENVSSCFRELIMKSAEKYGQRAVILVDEYDKPILDVITETEAAKEMREGLKNLYSVIKGQDAYIRFAFLTGVSKFSKVSIFSGLNNLADITIDERYSSICGYTEAELTGYFEDRLKGREIEQIRHWYNGYSWTGDEKVYNPFSILNYFDKGQFRNYWFETGTPTFLIELLKERRYCIPQIEDIEAGESLIGSFDIDFIEPETLLFQAGYLTIQGSYMTGNRLVYRLTYPNLEVRGALNDSILLYYSSSGRLKEDNQSKLYKCLIKADIGTVKAVMQSHFASIPADWYRKNRIQEYEGYYASVFYSYFASLGLDVRVEDATNHGRIDMTVVMPNAVFIFEFKVIDLVKETGNALEQIKTKGYAVKYMSLNLPVYLIGIEFDRKERNIVTLGWEQATWN